MSQLVPCAGCGRHVKVDEGACPFCGEAASAAPKAKVAAATTAGCSDSHRPGEDAGTEQEDAGPVLPDATIAPPYGAPPDDAGIAPLYGGAPGD